MNKCGELSICSNHIAEEAIIFKSIPSALDSDSSSPKPLWSSDDVYQQLSMMALSNDSTASTSSASSEAKDSSSSSLTYFQKLALKLSSSHEASSIIRISILSDNPATHSTYANGSKPQNCMPSLPPLDEYHPLDDFLPSLLKEKGLCMSMQAISVVSDNPCSSTPSVDLSLEQSSSLCCSTTNEACEDAAAAQCDSCHHSYGEQLSDEEKVLDCIVVVPQVKELKTSDDRFANDLSQMDDLGHSRVGRSNSVDVIYSTPQPHCKPKCSLTRALSFEDGKKNLPKNHDESGNIKRIFSKSPQSVLDLFNPEDTVELCSSFHSLPISAVYPTRITLGSFSMNRDA